MAKPTTPPEEGEGSKPKKDCFDQPRVIFMTFRLNIFSNDNDNSVIRYDYQLMS